VSPIRLAIFDLDGVITSTTHEHFLGWKKMIELQYGIDIPESVESLVKGISRAESYQRILTSLKLPMPLEKIFLQHLAQKNAIYLDLIDRFDESRILPGAKQLLSSLRQDGIQTALGSASRNAPKLLRSIGLADLFDHVVDPTTVPGKPNPGIFLAAMRHFGLTPGECVGFEDAPSGIEAIKAAGMIAVGIGNESLPGADFRFDSLADIVAENYRHLFEDNHGLPSEIER